MRYIYSFFMYLMTPWLLFRLWWKGRQLPAYRDRIGERFWAGMAPVPNIDVWVHAVSLGEVIAVTPLINEMLAKNWRLLITTMTPTGAEQVKTKFGDRVLHRYIPYDLPDVLQRFFVSVKPRAGVIVETELWPNLIHYASQAKIPLMLINARLSERSCRGYQKIKWLIKPVINQFTWILAQSDEDGRRFQQLGAKEGLVQTIGNMKFDLQTKDIDQGLFLQLKAAWGPDRPVLIIASTHDNEEEQILQQLTRLQASIKNILVLIAPRHPERFQKVNLLAEQAGFKTALRSKPETISSETDVITLDSMGELLGFYQISDYAFVGGSFVPIGGHNVLEPIAMKVPVFSGPEVHNFKTICRDLMNANAMIIVQSAAELIDRVVALHANEAEKEKLVLNATQVLKANKGAVARYLAVLETFVD
ncbi:lipid IV(A) 3-deoxy-D-manno-octulosonic acid transferase [Legionella quinlivanii]|uniref:lipid IV(A) 3-deoxy-D-manno-octulosonic acid transferase n=1 Tax=Legionella quinlivanii TaxID=45073 RepID=UPI002244E594|nr:lipid IV(A) 3-deoxy-D-manno-octulosonic acid transferase [Legionella quinlivanii]MCW8449934.1 lipid IV(A) 3-deoxy-D-manno-octulosonic acid transferase [Legionella quinlivanii]